VVCTEIASSEAREHVHLDHLKL